jgi:hypothetical protein
MINLRTAVRVEKVGMFPDGHGAVLVCDGKKVTITGLTKDEARLLGSHLYEELMVTITTDSIAEKQS